jgi:hypothetical protein
LLLVFSWYYIKYRNKGKITLLQNQYTYKYIAQVPGSGSPSSYGIETYGGGQYSCSSTDQICITGGPGAPNTGFLATSNPVMLGGIFITAALVIAVVVYAIFSKTKRNKAVK